MKRKSLIELMATVAATAALWGCATVPTPQPTANIGQEAARQELAVTRRSWAECVRAAIPRHDDPQSPSAVVAQAAMKDCSGEYAHMVQDLTRTLAPTCGRDPACTRDALAKAEREATQTATDDVLTARVQVAGAQVLKCQ